MVSRPGTQWNGVCRCGRSADLERSGTVCAGADGLQTLDAVERCVRVRRGILFRAGGFSSSNSTESKHRHSQLES